MLAILKMPLRMGCCYEPRPGIPLKLGGAGITPVGWNFAPSFGKVNRKNSASAPKAEINDERPT